LSKYPDLHLEALPEATRRALMLCADLSWLKTGNWYLAGGTALALQVGNRVSLDLDFFTPHKTYRELDVERKLLATAKWNTTLRESGTIFGTLAKAKVSFIAYPFFQPSPERLSIGAVRLLLPRDIAVMKIIAISQRGRKRDFFDLYWYCVNRESLQDVLARTHRHFPGQENNITHILKSLTYFDDAETDPAPQIFFKATWPEVKRYFRREVPRLARELLGLK